MCHGQILSAAIVQARKAHECDECGMPIAPSKLYHRAAIAVDGKLEASKLCRTCYAHRQEAQDYDGCFTGRPRDIARDDAQSNGWRNYLARARKHVASWRAGGAT